MMRRRFRCSLLLPALGFVLACSSGGDESASPEPDAGLDASAEADAAGETTDIPDTGVPETNETDSADAPDSGPDVEPPPVLCDDGLKARSFTPGGTARRRHEIAADFSVTRQDGRTWTFSEEWNGCDVYVFIPQTIPVSQLDSTSVWENDAQLAALLKTAPRNVHFFFVTRTQTAEGATPISTAMAERLGAVLVSLGAAENDFWWQRVHVVQESLFELPEWMSDVLASGIGVAGFTIDRRQRLRGFGSLADVNLNNPELSAAEVWPFEANLAMAAREAAYLNAEAGWEQADETNDATEIVLYDGEVIEEFGEVSVTLPDAETMAGFDTFEIHIDMRCPDPDAAEPGNCGAWDYLAHLFVMDGEERIELGRFITSYHRETRWTLDVTPMLPHLLDGGERTFRWQWAPSWNKQPTETRVTLRLGQRGRADKPFAVAPLMFGGNFSSTYNDLFAPMDVVVPTDATRVELYSVISGHGQDTSNCAEFCNHQHHWTVGTSTYTEAHPTVGDYEGCVGELERQMIPNQLGTWWFGRGGWCPGQPVYPWTQDVTSDAVDGLITVDYEASLFGGAPPDGAGNIVMTSWLVFYMTAD